MIGRIRRRDSLRLLFWSDPIRVSPVEFLVLQNIGTMLGEHAVGLFCLCQFDVGRVVIEAEHLGFIIAALGLSTRIRRWCYTECVLDRIKTDLIPRLRSIIILQGFEETRSN